MPGLDLTVENLYWRLFRMIRNVIYLVVGAMLLSGCVCVSETKRVPAAPTAPCPHVNAPEPVQVLRHVVLLKFKDDTTAADVRRIENAFAALPSKIDLIQDFEWGTDISVENLADGFTHCFFVTFLSEQDRDAYIPHPEHKKFGELLGPHLDKVLVIDYWVK